ncbi:MAG: MYXO-CTERM sorting domain-containing protein [Polyangiaceae bacterium]
MRNIHWLRRIVPGSTSRRRCTTSAAVVAVSASVSASALAAPTRVLPGPLSVAAGASAEQRALNTLRRTAPEIAKAELKLAAGNRAGARRNILRFAQMHQGVPVVFRGAGVALGPSGDIELAVTRVETDLPSVSATLPAAEAARRVARWSGLATSASDARLALFPFAAGVRLVWAVYPSGRPAGVPYAPILLVDAANGELLATWNAARFAKGRVYPQNPIATTALEDLDLDVPANATHLENERVKALNCIDNKAVKQINFGVTISVHTCDLEQRATADAGGDFLYDPPPQALTPEDEFSEVQIFFHTNKAYAYFTALGMSDLTTKPLPAVANLMMPSGFQTLDFSQMADPNLPFVPFSNAFFAPANPIFSSVFGLPGAAMWFGQGPKADYSYDGDVVYHEFGHAVIDHTLKLVGTYHADVQGLSSAPGAMNEGLADYFSAAITGDPKVGEYASTDLAPGLDAIRDLSGAEACPTDLSGEVHADSLLWTTALWKTRQSLSPSERAALDQAVFDVLVASPGGDLSFEDLATLIVASVKTGVSAAAADALSQEWTQRGVLPSCQRVVKYEGKPLSSTVPGLGGRFWAPGRQDMAVPGATFAPGILQFDVPVSQASELVVNFTQFQIGSSNPLSNGTPFSPSVLVRFGDEPLTFSYAAGVTSTADVTVPASATNGQSSASVAVPAGTERAFVMIVNTGDSTGAYNAVEFALEGVPDAGAGGSGGGDAGADAAPGPSVDSGGDEGCGCRAAGRDLSSGTWLSLLLLAASAVARRRRS